MGTNDSSEFAIIFDQYKEKVFRLCLGYSGDGDVAHDWMQDSFIKIWQHLSEFRNEADLGTWIYRIALNTCLSHLRAVRRYPTEPLHQRHHDELADEPSDREAKTELLYRCISELEEQDRIIITMVLESISHRQIAEIIGISEGNVRVKVHRIKEKLTKLYSRYEEL